MNRRQPKTHAGEHPQPLCKQARGGLYRMPLRYAQTLDDVTCRNCRRALVNQATRAAREVPNA